MGTVSTLPGIPKTPKMLLLEKANQPNANQLSGLLLAEVNSDGSIEFDFAGDFDTADLAHLILILNRYWDKQQEDEEDE